MSADIETASADRAQAVQISGTTFRREQVFFGFPSAKLNYDCVSCGFACCRGHGYATAVGAELDAQLAASPSLRLFVGSATGGALNRRMVRNLPPRCFFLQPSGLCSIHAKVGFSGKPETCRMFPFNAYRIVNDTLVVLPHPTLCPLEVTGHGSRSDQSDHGVLFEVMASKPLVASATRVLTRMDTRRTLELEAEILRQADVGVDRTSIEDFAEMQVDLTERIGIDADRDPAGRAPRRPLVDACEEAMRLLRITTSCAARSDEGLRRTLVALSPTVRSRVLFFGDEKSRGYPIGAADLPLFLLFLRQFAAAAIDAGVSSITYQTLSRLLSDHLPLLWLLSHWDRRLSLTPSVELDLRPFGDKLQLTRYLVTLRSFLPSAQRGAPTTVGEVLRANADGLEDPLNWLNVVARRLGGRLRVTGEAPAASRWKRRLHRSAQRFAISAVAPDLLAGVLRRSRGRRMPEVRDRRMPEVRDRG